MNTLSKTLYIIGGGLGAFALSRYLYKTFYLANQWDFNVLDVRHTSIFPRLKGVVELEIINVSNVKLDIKDINIDAYISNVKVGGVYDRENIAIAPNGKSKVPIKIAIEYKQLVNAFGSAYKDVKNIGDVPIELKGTFRVKTILGYSKIPIDYNTSGKELYAEYGDYLKPSKTA